MVPIKRFGGVESADTNGRQVLIAEPEKTLPVVRIVPETVCLPGSRDRGRMVGEELSPETRRGNSIQQ